jgi:hypothetical protein
VKKRHYYLFIMRTEGLSQSALARELGVTRQAISDALRKPRRGGKVQRFLSRLAPGEWFPICFSWNSIANAARSLGVKVEKKNKNLFRRIEE